MDAAAGEGELMPPDEVEVRVHETGDPGFRPLWKIAIPRPTAEIVRNEAANLGVTPETMLLLMVASYAERSSGLAHLVKRVNDLETAVTLLKMERKQ